MERYFKFIEDSELQRDYFEYKKNVEIIREMVLEFNVIYNIEFDVYYVMDELIYIILIEFDLNNYGLVFCVLI